jgi:hypothetical protein
MNTTDAPEQAGTISLVRPTVVGEYEFRGYIDSAFSEGKDVTEFCPATVFFNEESKRLNAKVNYGAGLFWSDYIGRFQGQWRQPNAANHNQPTKENQHE